MSLNRFCPRLWLFLFFFPTPLVIPNLQFKPPTLKKMCLRAFHITYDVSVLGRVTTIFSYLDAQVHVPPKAYNKVKD